MTSNLSMSDGLFKLELSKTETPNIGHGLTLQTVREGQILQSDSDRAVNSEISEIKSSEQQKEKSSGEKIFLIDLEEMKSENGKTVLKPSTKKVSLGSLLQSKMTNNWFFRNKEVDDEEGDNLVKNEDHHENSTEEEGRASRKTSKEESSKEDGPILSKLKNFVDKNKAKHREMNFWQPQGS